jgi:hypothetical protein
VARACFLAAHSYDADARRASGAPLAFWWLVAGGGGPEGRGIGRPPAAPAPARIGMRLGPRQERKGRAGVAAGALARLHLLPATGGGGGGGGGSSGVYYYYYWCARVWPDASDVTGNKGESAALAGGTGGESRTALRGIASQGRPANLPVPATESVTRRAALAFTDASPGPVRPTRAFSGARHSPALHARRATTGPRASVA